MSDFLSECNSGDLRIDPKTFRETWCVRCSRPECSLAGFAKNDPMAIRNATWRERFFGNNAADLSVPEFARINALDFPNMLQKAMKLEISARRGDWSVPDLDLPHSGIEMPITDGRSVRASPDTTTQVDEAVRRLRTPPDEGPEAQEQFPAEDDPEPEAKDDLPSAKSEPPLQETFSAGPLKKSSPAPRPTAGNTPDRGEVMIGGAPATSSREPPRPEADPWAPPPKPKHRVVAVGATITLGGKSND